MGVSHTIDISWWIFASWRHDVEYAIYPKSEFFISNGPQKLLQYVIDYLKCYKQGTTFQRNVTKSEMKSPNLVFRTFFLTLYYLTKKATI